MSGDIPLPGTLATGLVVVGTSTDWVKPIEDCVYAYIVDRWSIGKPTKDQLKRNNRSYDNNGWFHFWLQRGQTNGNRSTTDSNFWDFQTNLQINVLMKRLSKGQLDSTMDDIIREIRRSLIQYSPHWIAGVQYFDNFNEVPLVYGPDDERNPWQNTWTALVTVNAFWQYNSQFILDEAPYTPSMWSAGELTYV